jgi:hypothetical protein
VCGLALPVGVPSLLVFVGAVVGIRPAYADISFFRKLVSGWPVKFGTQQGTWQTELPHFSPPLLVLNLDQHQVQTAALNYLIYKLQACVVLFEDPYHREWNDTKLAIRRSGMLWKTVLHLKAAWDINYAPASNPKHWFVQKAKAATRWIQQVSHDDDPL